MARALRSKQVDDEIEVLTPTGKKHWYVNSIRYDRPGKFRELKDFVLILATWCGF
jgi:hypothetical protein